MVSCSYWNGTKWATDTFKWDWTPGSTAAGTPSAESFITMGGTSSGYTFMVDPTQIPNNGHVYKQIQLQYYTEADYSITANSTISNTAEYNSLKTSPTTPNTGIPNLGTPQKTVVLGTDYLEYTLLFDMPVAMYKQNFYITDTLTLGKDLNPNYRTDQGTGGKAPTLVSVEAVDKNNGTVLQAFTPGGTSNFSVHLNPGNEGAFTLFFKNNWQGGSQWLYNGDSILKIVYRVALDTVLWEDRNITTGSQRTVGDVLIKNAASNIAYGIYGAKPEKAESTLVVSPGMDKQFLSDKTQVQSDGSVLLYYQVEVNVYDPNTGNRYFTVQDMQGFTFSDDFENNLSYEPNTLKVETYSYDTTNKNYKLNSTYNANGKTYSDPMVVPVTDLQDGSGAAFADFICDKLIITYALRLDASEIIRNPRVVYPINNTATFENPGGTKKLSDQCKESYSSKLIDKTADPTLTDGNVIKFQIEINPKAMDLDPQSNTLTLEDTLGKVLEYRNGSMVVEESTDGGTTWTKLVNGTDWTTVTKTGGF
ncbi:MAG: hypothetical protein HUJ75_04645, partial [Parasporobacterium sp.]|nr:hypothetical protein [Parasporobacterium sp.]